MSRAATGLKGRMSHCVSNCLLASACLLLSLRTVNGQGQPVSGPSVSGHELLTRGLRGNKSYRVIVTLRLPADAELRSGQVGDQIRARLRQAGIGIIEEGPDGILGFPALVFEVNAAGPTPEGWYAITVRARVQDFLVTTRDSSNSDSNRDSVVFIGDCYGASDIFVVATRGIRQEVRLVVDELMDGFISDHLKMNLHNESAPAQK